MNDIAVYTAITNNRDFLKDEQVIDGADFICFTDDSSLKSKVWDIRKVSNISKDPNRNAKIHKILAHKYLDYDYSIWIDGSVSLLMEPEYLIKKYLKNNDIAVFTHRDERNCLYKEAKICIDKKLDDVSLIKEQVASYENNNYPADIGLYECTIILRKHTPEIEKLNNQWWAEICRYSRRDQISFNYVVDKLKISVGTIDGLITDGNYFKLFYHNGNLLPPVVKPKIPVRTTGLVKIILNKDKNLHPNKYKKGDSVDVPENIARRWINRGIAHYDNFDIETLKKFDYSDFSYIKHPKVSIIILVKDGLIHIRKCLRSLVEYTKNYQLIIIDNNSESVVREFLRQKQKELNFVLITNKENMGFSYGCNQGAKVAACKYLCFLNSDTMVSPNWLGRLAKGFKRSSAKIGMVGPSTCYSGNEQMITGLTAKRNIMTQEDINAVSIALKEGYKNIYPLGFCYLVKKEVMDKIGVFDYRRYGLGSSEETDFSWRASKYGYRGCWVKHSYVHHFGHATFIELGMDTGAERAKNVKIFFDRKKDPNLFIENDVKITDIIKAKKKQRKQ